jgi:hypothetical protein
MRVVAVFSISAVTIEVWPTEVPIWGLLTALLIAAFYVVPAGMIQAITNQQIGLNVITELIAGYILPGKPLALMIFKTFGYIVRHFIYFIFDMAQGYGLILDDVTSVAIHVRHEARSLHENPSKDFVLVSNCCYGSGRDNTTGRTTLVRSLSHQIK